MTAFKLTHIALERYLYLPAHGQRLQLYIDPWEIWVVRKCQELNTPTEMVGLGYKYLGG